jgi:hypothetical protein
MKKASKLLLVLLALFVAMALVIGCNGDPDDDKKNGDDKWVGTVEDWSFIRYGGNEFPEANISITKIKDDGVDVMELKWGSSAGWQANEFWALLPTDIPYHEYDGLTFQIKSATHNNYLILIRNTGEANAWRLGDEYLGERNEWVTIKLAFADANDPGWGSNFTQDSLNDWLDETKNSETRKRLYINPLLNPHVNGGEVDVTQTTLFKNIGLYKDGADDLILWKF